MSEKPDCKAMSEIRKWVAHGSVKCLNAQCSRSSLIRAVNDVPVVSINR